MNNIEIIQLTWKMDGVTPGTDHFADNPLARATECLFRYGRPFHSLRKCFFRGPDGILRWLGIFVHSAGDRLIFFPGFKELPSYVVAHNDEKLRWNRPFRIDHLSLESDRRSWHFTAPRSVEHLGKLYTTQLDPDRLHWFSISVATPDDLRIVREETVVSIPSPERDTDRRVESFRQVMQGATHQIVELNSDKSALQNECFLHFSVVVVRGGARMPTSALLGSPYSGPLVRSTHRPPIVVPLREHHLRLTDSIELEITATALSGHLRMPTIFEGASSFLIQNPGALFES